MVVRVPSWLVKIINPGFYICHLFILILVCFCFIKDCTLFPMSLTLEVLHLSHFLNKSKDQPTENLMPLYSPRSFELIY